MTDKLASTIDLISYPVIYYRCTIARPENRRSQYLPPYGFRGGCQSAPGVLHYYYGVNNLEAVRSGSGSLSFPHSSRSYVGVLPGNDGWPGPYAQLKVESPELYNLSLDPGERYNLFDAHPEIVEKLMEAGERARG
ncbi:MAG: hypothetical protein R2727_04720 [Bacteroidales bacterium]